MTLIDKIDTFWGFCHEKIEGSGEDSWCYSFNQQAGIIGVFDGCGGAGATVYKNIGNHTGAYLASRAAADATIRWFDKLCAGEGMEIKDLHTDLRSHLDICNRIAAQPSGKLKSTMMREFPTTAAIWVVLKNGNTFNAASVSAGDSRTYILDHRGLMQISKDDLRNEDAMSDIYNNASMTNVISASHSFSLSSTVCPMEQPGILIAATDGCFGYFKSPMEFEYMLLDCLMHANCVDAWDTSVQGSISHMAGDDQTMAVLALGYGSFETLKSAFKPRYEQMKKLMQYMGTDTQRHWEVWADYKHDYYRLAEGGIPNCGDNQH